MRVNFVVWSTERRSVPCVCSICSIILTTEQTTICKTICIIFFVACNTIASTALGELALLIVRCRNDQLIRSFLPAVVHLRNILPSGVFCSGTLSSLRVP